MDKIFRDNFRGLIFNLIIALSLQVFLYLYQKLDYTKVFVFRSNNIHYRKRTEKNLSLEIHQNKWVKEESYRLSAR